MRKNKIMRFASGLLVATLLTTCIISGTFAKYTSNAEGSDSARVAKWSFKVGNTDITTTNDVTFNLFNTVNEEDTEATEENLQEKNGSIIAPGTGGKFNIELTNASEVTAKYAIAFTETNNDNVPIEYSTNKTTWQSDITKLNITANDNETINYNGGKKTITVYWRWSYNAGQTPVKNQTDESDTALGTAGNAKVEVKAAITATQVD